MCGCPAVPAARPGVRACMSEGVMHCWSRCGDGHGFRAGEGRLLAHATGIAHSAAVNPRRSPNMPNQHPAHAGETLRSVRLIRDSTRLVATSPDAACPLLSPNNGRNSDWWRSVRRVRASTLLQAGSKVAGRALPRPTNLLTRALRRLAGWRGPLRTQCRPGPRCWCHLCSCSCLLSHLVTSATV